MDTGYGVQHALTDSEQGQSISSVYVRWILCDSYMAIEDVWLTAFDDITTAMHTKVPMKFTPRKVI